MTCEQCYVCEQTVLQCSRTMLLAMTYDLCHGGHMVAEYLLLHTLPPPHQVLTTNRLQISGKPKVPMIELYHIELL